MNTSNKSKIDRIKVLNFLDFLKIADSLVYEPNLQRLTAKNKTQLKTFNIPNAFIKELDTNEFYHILGDFYGKVYKRLYIKKTRYPFIVFRSDNTVITEKTLTAEKTLESSLTVNSIVWYEKSTGNFANYSIVVPSNTGGWYFFNLSTGGLSSLNLKFNTAYSKYRGKV